MNKKYYTSDGKHPEDAIVEVKDFVCKLVGVQMSFLRKLSESLNFNKTGECVLVQYVLNVHEDIAFEEYLDLIDVKYSELVDNKKNAEAEKGDKKVKKQTEIADDIIGYEMFGVDAGYDNMD